MKYHELWISRNSITMKLTKLSAPQSPEPQANINQPSGLTKIGDLWFCFVFVQDWSSSWHMKSQEDLSSSCQFQSAKQLGTELSRTEPLVCFVSVSLLVRRLAITGQIRRFCICSRHCQHRGKLRSRWTRLKPPQNGTPWAPLARRAAATTRLLPRYNLTCHSWVMNQKMVPLSFFHLKS